MKNKTMKIIDLLVDIANNKEVPKKIKYLNNDLIYDNHAKDYCYISTSGFITTDTLLENINGNNLNDEVEILEDKLNKIDLLKFDYDHTIFESEFQSSNNLEEKLIERDDLLQEKINELIEQVNYLLGKEGKN